MTTFTNKQDAQIESEKINTEKGFKISFVVFIGETLLSTYDLDKKGWYVQNKETNNFY